MKTSEISKSKIGAPEDIQKTNNLKKRILIIAIPVALLITISLCFMIVNLKNKITGQVADTYLEDLELYDCTEAGKWDGENQNFKLTECPDDRPIMEGVGIAVTNDAQSGGRAYCCKAKSLEVYDCKEESIWEKDMKDYELTVCPAERPIMKGIGIKIKSGNQAGGKALCCKGNEVELYFCAVTSYWTDSNKDYKKTFCPEDRPILGGVGFNIARDNQEGGKAYCCKGRIRLEESGEEVSEEEVEEEEEVGVVEGEGVVEEEEPVIVSEKESGFCGLAKKVFC